LVLLPGKAGYDYEHDYEQEHEQEHEHDALSRRAITRRCAARWDNVLRDAPQGL
jgi:hypothetical protein